MQVSGQQPQRLYEFVIAHPRLKPAMAGLVRGILFRHLGPLRSGAEHPQHPVEHLPRPNPRTPTVILAPQWMQDRFDTSPQRRLELIQIRRKQSTKCL
jgi:hypothetical protein